LQRNCGVSSERDGVAGVGHAVQSNKQRGLSATFNGAKEFERVAAGIGRHFLRDPLMHCFRRTGGPSRSFYGR
jgi:hypothetical protein